MSERVIARSLSIFSATEEDKTNYRLFNLTSRLVCLTWQVSSQGIRDVTECVGLGKQDIIVVVVDARRRKRAGPTILLLVPVPCSLNIVVHFL